MNILEITKRNGTVVPFDANKLTKWAEWASVVGADWFSIASDAYKKCPDKCTTEELQNAMILACCEKQDTAHMKMAGRLLMGNVYKEAFGGHENIPKLSYMYCTMIDRGLWEEMYYSIDDLIYLNSIIDHSKDLNSVHSVIHQITTKYAIKDIETGRVLESPAFVWMRMALGICKNEPKETRAEEVKKYYIALSEGMINTPTPNIVNLGTPKRNYASCAVFKSNDTADSLAAGDHIAYKMTCASAGIGGMLQTRSKGDGIRKNTIKHSGKIPYYKAIESAAHANMQGSRGGAVTMHYNCLDPEIETLLRLRHPTTPTKNRVGGIDYSFGYHPLLAEKAANNEQWMLVSYKACPELHDALYNNQINFKDVYDKYEKSSGRRKYVSARKLALEFLKMQEEIGREYEHNIFEMNHHTSFKDKIHSSNLCVAPETKILTKNGYVEISSLQGRVMEVWNGVEWSEATIAKTGTDRELLKVKTKDGFELECTPEHKFYIYKRASKKCTEVPAKDLKNGDKLIKFSLPVIDGPITLENAYANGFYSGDGCLVGGDQRLYFYGEKRKLIKHCGDIFFNHYTQEKYNREYLHTRKLKEKFFVPNCQYTLKSRLEWLAGIFDADGTIVFNGKTQSLQLGSVEHGFLKDIQTTLQTMGVLSKVTKNSNEGMKSLPLNNGTKDNGLFFCKTSYRLLIGNDGVSKLLDLGFKPYRLSPTNHRPNRECSHFIKIESVVNEGRISDTYCLTEPKRHMAMFNGILTGQCQEIGLPTEGYESVQDLYASDDTVKGEIGLCNLGAIVAGRVSEEQYEEIAYLTLKMVDNVISDMEYPFPHLKFTAQARRSAGIGITNLAHDLAKQGLTYTGEKGKAYMHRLAERHSYWLHKASVRLAKERGKCEWFHKTKYADGWLLIDTYAKQVDKITSQPLLFDWEELRREIKEYGMRNSVLEAFMPVESSSIAGNTTNSIYPIRRLVTVKTSGTNKTIFLAPDMEELQWNYQLAWDVPTKDMTEMYAIFQKFTGQGISCDYYRKFEDGELPRISAKELLNNWYYRILCGIKNVYYTNTAAGHDVGILADKGCGSGGCTL